MCIALPLLLLMFMVCFRACARPALCRGFPILGALDDLGPWPLALCPRSWFRLRIRGCGWREAMAFASLGIRNLEGFLNACLASGTYSLP
jgi:hypothetical protein